MIKRVFCFFIGVTLHANANTPYFKDLTDTTLRFKINFVAYVEFMLIVTIDLQCTVHHIIHTTGALPCAL
jgi:hypothetical protein